MIPRPGQDLSTLNTLHLPARAELFAAPATDAALQALLVNRRYQGLPRTVLGEGSNVVLADDIPGLVIHPALRGLRCLADEGDTVIIEVGAGENWDAVVERTLAHGWYGLENLSLIPGSAGAAPYQNIGAYGVELEQFLVSLDAVHLASGRRRRFTHGDCRFAYRDSFFRSAEPGEWVVLRLRLRLFLRPRFELSHQELREQFLALPERERTAQSLRALVCGIRRSKLPHPDELANAGSFFKNPVISAVRHEQLRRQWPDLVSFPLSDGRYKVAAGWLLEQAGWKGFREGALGMHQRQALVLVHYGGASGREVLGLARRLRASVRQRFGIELEQEPVILPPEVRDEIT